MSLKIIGAGYPRTGTTSLKTALEMLGFGPCCHMWELFKPEHVWRWQMLGRAFDGKPVHWPTVYRGFGAAVDAPGCFFWRKLAHAFPEARVILTVRDPHGWLRSMQSGTAVGQGRLDRARIDPIVPAMIARMEQVAIGRERGSGPEPAPGPARDAFLREELLRHAETVKREIAADRLLVFQVSEGWGPLCRFLGVPEPAAPFPHDNDIGDFARRVSAVTGASPAPV